ncbi:MAPKBP1 [Mytilus coruscus]|uniref:MAPKBP1 n=1 Tax=Mytilus coruscus TaxID=42192 RepID=A0A6J8E713_MYTCO|nr:MAPKBP1 [Mytilus coruscus]
MVIDPTEKFAATACQDRNIRVIRLEVHNREPRIFERPCKFLTQRFEKKYSSYNVYICMEITARDDKHDAKQTPGPRYQEAEVATNNNNNETFFYFVVFTAKPSIPATGESEFKTPSKILAELNEYNQKQQQHPEQQKAKPPLDYRFSIRQLPNGLKINLEMRSPKVLSRHLVSQKEDGLRDQNRKLY